MVGSVGNILNAAQKNQLTALQKTARAVDEVSLRLATGRDVNGAIDDPSSFFTARAFDDRASDLERRLDGIKHALRTVELTQEGLKAAERLINLAESYVLQYKEDFLAGNIDLSETLDTSMFREFSSTAQFITYGGGGQDSGAPIQITEGGFGYRSDDNAWRRTAVNYTVTATTVVEFDFRSSNIPEIATIGFDNDLDYVNAGSRNFFLYGTQTSGVPYTAPTPTYEYDGSGDWVHVTIPVGTYFTGNFSHLTFINDDDGGGDDGDAEYRNIVIHEGDYVYGATTTVADSRYEREYAAILDQLDELVQDTQYRGINLLKDEDMETFFNENMTNSLITEGIEATTQGLGLLRAGLDNIEQVDDKLEQIFQARKELRLYASSLAVDFNILTQRDDFTRETINVLKAGRDDLTVSDQNRDGAQMLALQTRQLIQVTTLTLNNTANIVDYLF